MSLRVRINLIMSALIVLFTLVTGNIIVNDMRRSIREEMEAGGKVTEQLLTTVPGMPASCASGAPSERSWRAITAERRLPRPMSESRCCCDLALDSFMSRSHCCGFTSARDDLKVVSAWLSSRSPS